MFKFFDIFFKLALLPLLFLIENVNAQVSSNYVFSQSSGTYTPITGGTNYNAFTNFTNNVYTGNLPITASGFLDEPVSTALLPIGFNFVYNGVTYTQFGIAANGFISLGALPVSSLNPIWLGTSNNVISGLGADLVCRGSLLANRTNNSTTVTITGGDISLISVGDKVSGNGIPAGATVVSKTATTVTISAAATSNGTGFHFRFINPNAGIRFQTIGTAPNRTLVVQWTGWQRYTTSGGFGELYNFQIRLNETSNVIDVVYNLQGPTSTTNTTFEIGLRGSSNADFNNRSTTTDWSATVAGTANSSTVRLRNTVKPASGLTFTWTPVSCIAPTGLTSSSVTTSSATISWTAASPTPSSGYDYYVSTNSTAPTSGTTPTGTTTGTSVNLTSLSANQTHYFWVRSNCGSGNASVWAGSSTFFTGILACTNTFEFGSAAAPSDNVSVTINTCNFQGDYSVITGVVSGNTYQFGYSLGGYISIRSGSYNGTAVAGGNAPLTWTATSSGTFYVHYNTNSSCGTASSCGTSTITCTSCPAPLTGCINFYEYITANAPTSNTPLTIATDQWQEDYNVINNVQAATTYQSSYSLGGFITVRIGSYNGSVIASGNSPLTWTSTTSGTYFIHYNTNSSCGTDDSDGTSTLTCTSCPAPVANPTSITASTSFVCSGSGTSVTLTAVGAVGTVYWFTGSCGTTGQINTGNSITVTPTATTTYFARNFSGGVFSDNCASTTIQFRTTPTVSAGTATQVCEGSSVTLNATAVGSTRLTVSTTGGFGCTGGNMFDVTVGSAPIKLTAFDIVPNSSGTQNVRVYYKTGTYVGSETNQAAWTLLGTFSVTGTAGTVINVPVTTLDLLASTTYGIYVNYDAVYSFGSTTVNDDFITVNAGIGLCGLFTSTVNSRSFLGRIYYETTPTLAWTPSATLSANNILNPVATPTAPTTYILTGTFLGCSASSTVDVSINTLSTSPTINPVSGKVCPNTNTNLTASGGVDGTGSTVRWYWGPNGTGGTIGSGSSVNVLLPETTTVYVRREGTCNNSADNSLQVNVKSFGITTVNTASTSNYCTDAFGWKHFYDANDDVIFSASGDFSMCSSGYPNITIAKKPGGGFYTQSQGSTSLCNQNLTPGEMKFEMGRNWNVDMGGANPIGNYSVRFYHLPNEKSDVVNAAADAITQYTSCGYTYKYNLSNQGWFWFKNTGSNYVAPQWEGSQYTGTTSTTINNVTYVELTSLPGFSGGTGGIILIPDATLPIELKSFTGFTNNQTNFLNWVTSTELNSSYFDLEKSVNGVDFESITTLTAAGTSLEERFYSFDDKYPFNGLNYYRLKSVDLDGSYQYSNVIVLETKTLTKDSKFYPNPTSNTLTYSFEELELDVLEIEVFDMLGKLISTYVTESRIGINSINIDLSNLVEGFYKVKVTHKNKSVVNTELIIKK